MRADTSMASGKDILEFVEKQVGSWDAITRRTQEEFGEHGDERGQVIVLLRHIKSLRLEKGVYRRQLERSGFDLDYVLPLIEEGYTSQGLIRVVQKLYDLLGNDVCLDFLRGVPDAQAETHCSLRHEIS